MLGSPQVRNRATLGGNICNGSPAADMVLPLIGYGASAKWVGIEGEEECLLEDFFLGPGKTKLGVKNLLLDVEVPLERTRVIGVYHKLGKRKGMEIAIVNLAVLIVFSSDRHCSSARIVLGSVSPTAVRAKEAEALLAGRMLSREVIEEAGRVSMTECKPITDLRASAEYRREMVRVLVRRSLEELNRRNGAIGQ